MHSLDFEEFLWANGVTSASVADIREHFDKRKVVPAAMHERVMELFKEYIVVGGMWSCRKRRQSADRQRTSASRRGKLPLKNDLSTKIKNLRP